MNKPILFWADATVRRPDGTTAEWGIYATATPLASGMYRVEVRVTRPRGTLVYPHFTVTRLEGRTIRQGIWEVSSEHEAPLNRVIQSDGYDFPTLKAAVWAIASACLCAAISTTFGNAETIAWARINTVLGSNPRWHADYSVDTYPRPQAATV